MSNETFFETIKCEDYKIYNLKFHNTRLAKTIAKNINLAEYIYPLNSKLLKCKVIYNENEILSVDFETYKKRNIQSFKLIYDDNISYGKKSTSRGDINKLSNKKDNSDEIIIIKNNLISDTSIANIAIFDGYNWLTPKTPLLEGTCRARLLEKKQIFKKDITLAMLQNAKKIALMNAMIDFDILETYTLV